MEKKIKRPNGTRYVRVPVTPAMVHALKAHARCNLIVAPQDWRVAVKRLLRFALMHLDELSTMAKADTDRRDAEFAAATGSYEDKLAVQIAHEERLIAKQGAKLWALHRDDPDPFEGHEGTTWDSPLD